MKTAKFAIAGIGSAARTHALAIDEITDATLVAGACRTESKGRSFAAKFDCSWYDNVKEMLDAETPDILSVCTPSGAHLQPMLAAAERGIDVICEKPLELTTDRIDRMVDAATEHGIRLGGIFQCRYLPAMQAVQDAITTGQFGSLAVANAYVPWWRPDDYYDGAWQSSTELDGGATMNQSIHAVDAVQWLTGASMNLEPGQNPVAEVFAYSGTRGHDDIDVEDTTVATLRYRDGTIGQLLSTTAMYPGAELTIQIGGRDGSVEIRDGSISFWQPRMADMSESSLDNPALDVDVPDPLETANIRAFIDAWRADEPFELGHMEARKAVEIVEAIYHSAETNQPVSV